MRAPGPRWPEKLPEAEIPAVEANNIAGRLPNMVFTGEVAVGSVGVAEVCTRGGGCVGRASPGERRLAAEGMSA